MKFHLKILLILFSILGIDLVSLASEISTSQQGIGLDQFLGRALSESDKFKTIDQSMDALILDLKSRDSSLSSKLQADLYTAVDGRDMQGVDPAAKQNTGMLGVSFAQPFSTGTQLSLSASNYSSRLDIPEQKSNTAAWELKLSQALWKNAFGRGITLQLNRDETELKERLLSLQFDKQKAIVDFESLYWEILYSEKELRLRKENVSVSQTLEKWVSRRLKQFAAEDTDVVQVQTLLGQRQLDLVTADNRVQQLKKKVAQYFTGVDISQWQFDLTDFEKDRDVSQLLVKPRTGEELPSVPLRIDAASARYASERLKSESLLKKDSYRPDLSLYLSYGNQGINENTNTSWNRANDGSNSLEKIGVVFTYNLDVGRQADQEKAASRLSESYDTRARSLGQQSRESWNELVLNLKSLKEQVILARKVFELNKKKITIERKRFQSGRTSTLQMTTFEVDAAESELRFYRVVANLRRTEGQARTFIQSSKSGQSL